MLENKSLMYECGKCHKSLLDSQESVACDLCGTWFHMSKTCSAGYDPKKDARSKKKDIEVYWLCQLCKFLTNC